MDACTWSESVATFGLRLVEDERSPHTRAGYRADLDAFARWFRERYSEEPTLESLVASELREWKTYLREQLGREPATVNRKLSAVRSFLTWAAEAGRIEPVVTPKSIRQVRPAPRWLARRDQKALLRAVERSGQPRDIAVVRLFLHTGLRVAELVALRWGDISVSERKGELTVRAGKGRKQRTVPLNVEARAALLELKAQRRDKAAAEVLHGQRGPLRVRAVQAIVERYGAAAKLEGLSCHVLRHTWCKNLADQGVRLEVIAALAGHESLETTRRYVEPGREDLAAAVDRLTGEE